MVNVNLLVLHEDMMLDFRSRKVQVGSRPSMWADDFKVINHKYMKY